ncbi:MAG TPA: sensor domain-containing diguanylate cyclase, partial [Rudaea sp.]|nr:sensor domain-containing diguanylate cyclase [Rudaea sp.]
MARRLSDSMWHLVRNGPVSQRATVAAPRASWYERVTDFLARGAPTRWQRETNSILDAVDDAVLVADARLRVVAGNTEACKLLGLEWGRVLGASLTRLLGARLRTAAGERVDFAMLTQGWAGEVDFLLDERTALPIWLRVAPTDSAQPQRAAVTVVLSDLSLLKQVATEARGPPRFDPVTGLANRSTIFERLEHVLAQAGSAQRTLALLFIGVNRLDLFRDAVEDASADRLLREVAQRLSHCGFAEDAIGRFSDDEFVAILQDLPAPDQIAAVAGAVLHALAWRVKTGSDAMSVSANIGIALFPTDGDNSETLLRAGHVALEQARASGSGRFEFCR